MLAAVTNAARFPCRVRSAMSDDEHAACSGPSDDEGGRGTGLQIMSGLAERHDQQLAQPSSPSERAPPPGIDISSLPSWAQRTLVELRATNMRSGYVARLERMLLVCWSSARSYSAANAPWHAMMRSARHGRAMVSERHRTEFREKTEVVCKVHELKAKKMWSPPSFCGTQHRKTS
jgi:hypothetical protein